MGRPNYEENKITYEELYNKPQPLVDKTGNQINVIFPYRDKHGIWKFDDPEVGLQAEPFVGNINLMLDTFANGKTECKVFISKDKIIDSDLSLTNIDDDKEFPGHYLLDGSSMVGWLCPATLKYFKEYPEKIYAKIETNE
jgi:hypothetical protein